MPRNLLQRIGRRRLAVEIGLFPDTRPLGSRSRTLGLFYSVLRRSGRVGKGREVLDWERLSEGLGRGSCPQAVALGGCA